MILFFFPNQKKKNGGYESDKWNPKHLANEGYKSIE
jgi:hypothetical protein